MIPDSDASASGLHVAVTLDAINLNASTGQQAVAVGEAVPEPQDLATQVACLAAADDALAAAGNVRPGWLRRFERWRRPRRP